MTFEEWKEGYGLVFEPNYSKETEADCLAAFNFGKREAAVLIERQAAQIEQMREAQIDAERYRWLRNALSDRTENGVSHHFCSIRTSEELDMEIDKTSKKKSCEGLVVQPNQALEQFAAKVREQCAQMLLNGSFLHDQSPAKLFATEAAKAIRAIIELPK